VSASDYVWYWVAWRADAAFDLVYVLISLNCYALAPATLASCTGVPMPPPGFRPQRFVRLAHSPIAEVLIQKRKAYVLTRTVACVNELV
jgi:hypothetical protein